MAKKKQIEPTPEDWEERRRRLLRLPMRLVGRA
jgi:hypothetical protein